MRELKMIESKKIAAGTSNNTNQNTVEYGDNCLYGTVVVPHSANGQVVHLSVQVVEDTFIHKWLNS